MLIIAVPRAMGVCTSVTEVKKEGFKDIALRAHNKVRKTHDSPPLSYSKDLSMHAQNHALYLTRTNSKTHRSARYCQGTYIGENIAEKFLTETVKEYGGDDVTEDWYTEIENYSYFDGDPPGSIKTKCRNFTQVIWKASTEVGFGVAKNGKRVIVVACYNPTGNRKGEYAKNVLPQRNA